MSAELLRKAATILRETAGAADRCTTDKPIRDMTNADFMHTLLPSEADYVRVVGNPGVGLALLALLENLAVDMENFDLDGTTGDVAVALARLIVGEAS